MDLYTSGTRAEKQQSKNTISIIYIIKLCVSPSTDTYTVRNRGKFKVNKARTETYDKATIPYLQGRLNEYYLNKDKLERSKEGER